MEKHRIAERFLSAVHRRIVGYDDVIENILIAMILRGHVLLEGVPGVAKTLLARTVAQAVNAKFKRIQFTPDMMPTDITGTTIFDFHSGKFSVQFGPVFTDVLLADEINRTPPKTQAALLEAMQEQQVTLDGKPHPLSGNFFVIATQNPLEYEGTYPLPEAQVDRFIMKLTMDYLEPEQEMGLYTTPPSHADAPIQAVLTPDELDAVRVQVEKIHVEKTVVEYISAVVQATRTSSRLRLGCSPRGAQFLTCASRAAAHFAGREYVIPDDVKAVALPILRHRLLLDPEAQLEGWSTDRVVEEILQAIPATHT